MAGGGIVTDAPSVPYLTGRALIFPLSLIISLFFLWGFSYGLLDVLNKHFQAVLGISRLQSTGLQVAYFGGGYFVFSPVAAYVLKKHGYKKCILMGLSFYSIGAVMFWPCAHFATPSNAHAAFGGFVVCTFIIACGLATLETAANSYGTVIGAPETAALRLQFCQSWNGVASFIGPLIASKFFFSGGNASNLTNVQWVYLAVSLAGVAIAILFTVTKLPEVEESALQAAVEANADLTSTKKNSFWRQYNAIFAFIAQFCYVGAQVTVASFFIFYVTENATFDTPTASNFLSYSLIIFTIARFVGSALLNYIAADLLLVICAAICVLLAAMASALHGTAGVACVMALFAFESIQYPVIFVLGTENLGIHTRRAAGLLVQGVAGGAVFPPIQGAIADQFSTRISYLVPMVGFIYVFGYALFHFARGGFVIRRKIAGVVPTNVKADVMVVPAMVNDSYEEKSSIEAHTVEAVQKY